MVPLESGCLGRARLAVLGGFVFRGWDVPDGFEDAAVVELVGPQQGGVRDVLEASPRSPQPDDLGLRLTRHWSSPSGRRASSSIAPVVPLAPRVDHVELSIPLSTRHFTAAYAAAPGVVGAMTGGVLAAIAAEPLAAGRYVQPFMRRSGA